MRVFLHDHDGSGDIYLDPGLLQASHGECCGVPLFWCHVTILGFFCCWSWSNQETDAKKMESMSHLSHVVTLSWEQKELYTNNSDSLFCGC